MYADRFTPSPGGLPGTLLERNRMRKLEKPVHDAQMYHAAWLKALAEGRFEIPCPTPAAAQKLRFGLYNSVKRVRSGEIHAPDLLRAVEEVSVSLGKGESVVRMVHKSQLDELLSLSSALGGEIPVAKGVETGMSAEEAESAARIAERLGMTGNTPEPAPAPRKTPFYTREG